MSRENNIVISARFHPSINSWSGFGVEMGVTGTHVNYNVFYNGECDGEYYNSENEAKIEALREYLIYKIKK